MSLDVRLLAGAFLRGVYAGTDWFMRCSPYRQERLQHGLRGARGDCCVDRCVGADEVK